MNTKKIALKNSLTFCLLVALTVIFIFPIVLVFLNSFKSRLYVSTVPFAWPKGNMYVGFDGININNSIKYSLILYIFIGFNELS